MKTTKQILLNQKLYGKLNGETDGCVWVCGVPCCGCLVGGRLVGGG